MSRGLAYARLVRLPNVFTAMADVSIGLIIGASVLRWPQALLILLSSACLYSAGMVWNDYFDRLIDARERPSRPIPSGAFSPRGARQVAVILSCVGLVGAIFTPIAGIHAAILLALILAYDGGLKHSGIGPFVMASCRAVNVLLGFSLLDSDTAPRSMRVAFALVNGCYVLGITLFARSEAGKSSVRLLQIASAIIFAAIAGGCVAATLAAHPWSGGIYVFAALAIVLLWKVGPALATPDAKRVQIFVKSAIFGIVILDAALAASAAGPAGLAIIVWLLPASWLGRHIYST